MDDFRREWMRGMVTRQPRMFDAQIVATKWQGSTFFASTTMIAIGGGLALLGNTERLAGDANDLAIGIRFSRLRSERKFGSSLLTGLLQDSCREGNSKGCNRYDR